MEISVIIPHVEALIFASEKPVTTLDLLELVNNAIAFMEERATLDQVESAIEAVREKYSSEFYPFEVRESGGGWQFLTKGTYHKTVAVLNGDKFLKRLSSAALETLAIIAYKQPITKGEIESIRGVNSDYAVQKLLEKELVIITGRKEDAPGHPLIYATSKTFMDYFGINSPDELPKLSDIVPTDMVMPTAVGEAHMVDSDVEAEQLPDSIAPLENTGDENSAEVNMLAVNADGEMEEIMLNAEATIDAAEAIEEVQEEITEIETAEEATANDDTAADAPDEDAAAPADDEPTQA
ncbi:MAG: SMC-Scp complex subunit ScpB [Chitinophagaceae bacterium]|nr:SMC-Scp complex subunit ScpB [Chitinophagaceae bacterium]